MDWLFEITSFDYFLYITKEKYNHIDLRNIINIESTLLPIEINIVFIIPTVQSSASIVKELVKTPLLTTIANDNYSKNNSPFNSYHKQNDGIDDITN